VAPKRESSHSPLSAAGGQEQRTARSTLHIATATALAALAAPVIGTPALR